MLYKYCNKEINDNHICLYCGRNISYNDSISSEHVTPPPLPSHVIKKSSINTDETTSNIEISPQSNTGTKYFYEIRKIIFIIGAIIFVIISFEIAKEFDIAGTRICNITSVGGRTLEEAYYSRLGIYVFPAIAKVIRMLGIFCGAILYTMRHKA